MNEPSRQAVPRRDVSGILLLDKPPGMSSNRALQRAKRAFGARKAGHTGNLDGQATGLLPVCFGEATKISPYLLDADKAYVAEIKFGEVTDTGDCDGTVIRRQTSFSISRDALLRALDGFRGDIEQVPPMYSALKHQGQRLYRLAQKGITVERKPRPVSIREISLESFAGDRAVVSVACSKGTYIRTLAEDIGEELGCGAHLAELRRTRTGPFSLDAAHTLERVESLAEQADAWPVLDDLLVPIDAALAQFPCVRMSEESAYYLERGQAVRVPHAPTTGFVRLYRGDDEFLGIGTVLPDGRVAPRRLMRVAAT